MPLNDLTNIQQLNLHKGRAEGVAPYGAAIIRVGAPNDPRKNFRPFFCAQCEEIYPTFPVIIPLQSRMYPVVVPFPHLIFNSRATSLRSMVSTRDTPCSCMVTP